MPGIFLLQMVCLGVVVFFRCNCFPKCIMLFVKTQDKHVHTLLYQGLLKLIEPCCIKCFRAITIPNCGVQQSHSYCSPIPLPPHRPTSAPTWKLERTGTGYRLEPTASDGLGDAEVIKVRRYRCCLNLRYSMLMIFRDFCPKRANSTVRA